MEIIIVGVIFVAIMVVVSTKIKKSAAMAFEAETVDKSAFSIEKPDGFLYPMRDKTKFAFEAYSKVYGERSTRNIWRARVRLRVFDDLDLEKLTGEIKDGIENIESEKHLDDLPENQNGLIITSRKTEDNAEYKILRKLIEVVSHDKIYELKTTILEPYGKEYTDKACELMRSFVVK